MDLSEIGLTKNEAKAYKTSLLLGKSTASEICKESGVPYGRIYDVLASLEGKGLVKVLPEKTKSYVPSDPKSLHDYIQKRKEQLDEIEKQVKEFKSLYEEYAEEPVQIAKGKKNFYRIFRQLHKPDKTSYSLKYTFELHPEFIREVKRLKKKGADYRALGRIDEETKQGVEEWKKITPNIKPIENEGVAISIVDDKEIMIALIKSNVIMLIKDKPFIKIMKTLFLNYYEQS